MNETSSLGRRAALILGLGAVLAGPAAAQQPTPQAFLEAIYKPYLAKDFNGQPYGEADRFFAPALAAAMERDMQDAKRRGEPPTLDGDPFVDAQEWQITDLVISVKSLAALYKPK